MNPSPSQLQQRIDLTPDLAETAVRFDAYDDALVGNLVQPRQSAPLGVVFAHGWSGNRSGPHGILTHIARELGHAGFPSIRFDFRGRGESTGNGMATTLATMASDLVAAATLLQRECGVRKLVYLGVCSGGNVAIGNLPRLPAPAGLVLLSVYPFSDGDSFGRDVHRTWHYAREYARKACRAETWGRLVRGDIRLRQVGNVLFGHLVRRKKRDDSTEPQGQKTPESSPPKKHLAKLRPDLPALLIYGTADPDTRAARQYYEEYATMHRLPLEFVEIPGANHNFSSVAWTRQITELTVGFCRKIAGQPT
ncbi:MAG: hypothetical protein A3K19_33585 [Lentisphaerae bacterium RIFOXYB12_FULL_65_16]|nr:MAG: hypothetical protein A3K19_00160 [Lentisphaerae bacterium RIFOXYB12_FULL_65_16]OGV95270.1 MAG: hypothetical protein A3K19_33585 [Lentisphaerae bacterium RIFOXYB12_FULL_65_16]